MHFKGLSLPPADTEQAMSISASPREQNQTQISTYHRYLLSLSFTGGTFCIFGVKREVLGGRSSRSPCQGLLDPTTGQAPGRTEPGCGELISLLPPCQQEGWEWQETRRKNLLDTVKQGRSSSLD